MIYFISGHRDLSKKDFDRYYIPAINKAVTSHWNAEFVVGDCDGVDKMAMDYIANNLSNKLTIYHMFETPRNTPNGWNIGDCKESDILFEGGFTSDECRDSAMTSMSDFDIAFVFNNRWNSGTAQNIKRRHDA